MFPGVTSEPFSVVKLGPVCGPDAYSGYSPTANIAGFSMMHESGTGGAPKYGVVSQQPVPGNISNPLEDLSAARSSPDQAQVGFYENSLSSGVNVHLAATSHAALFNYAFPESSQSNVVVDVSHVLTSVGRPQWSQHYVNGNITVLPDNSYQGSGTYNNGWNLAPDWTVYFCGYIDAPPTALTFAGNGTTLSQYSSDTSVSGEERIGAVFSSAQVNITSRVGISFLSSDKACDFVNTEIPIGTPLQSLVDAAKWNWNTEVFSKIQTPETDVPTLELLYSSLYGMNILPSNRTGENPLWDSIEPYYDDILLFGISSDAQLP